MRILHLISSLDPAGGGPQMVAMRLAAAQANLGQQVSILSYETPQANQRITTTLRETPHGNLITPQYLPPMTRAEQFLGTTARKQMDRFLVGVDFVHMHGVWEQLLKVAASAASRLGVPYAIVPHGMLDPWSLSQKKFKKKLALAMGVRQMLGRAAFLHVLNEDEKRLIEPLGLRCPMEVIPNGIFLEELRDLPPSGSFYAANPQLNGRPYILFLSRLHYKKGLDYLADAFAILAQKNATAQLVVAGPDGGAREPFVQQIASKNLRQRVHIVPPLYGKDKWAALLDAACFCLPSRQEGFSMAILESLACGVPAVISQSCHFPEVQQSGAGFVLPLQADAFADALQRVLEDADLRQRMGSAARELATTRYTWHAVAEQTLHAYARFGKTLTSANRLGG
jgi:glycosyltransferase involved in cell wall biosynthesis